MKKDLKNALGKYYSDIPQKQNEDKINKIVLTARTKMNKLTFAEADMLFPQFFLTQIKFIKKRVWIGQFSALLLFGILLFELPNEANSLSLISALIPIIFILCIDELSRAFIYNTAEVELSTTFTLNQVMISRITILGLSDILILTCVSAMAVIVTPMNLLHIFMYLCVPFLITSFGCLYILNHIRTKECNYYCIAWGVLIMAGAFALSKAAPKLYEASLISGWAILFAIALLCTAIEIKLLLKNCTNQTSYRFS